MNLDFLLNFELNEIFTAAVRWVFVLLGIYILVRSIRSLLRTKNPAEVWAYMHLRTFTTDGDGNPADVEEISVPVTHWENVIGRAGSCDISIDDPTLSRNHGILMRDENGDWSYSDLGSKNGTYLNGEEIDGGRGAGRSKKSRENIRLGKSAAVQYGDVLRAGMTEMVLMPISVEEKNNNIAMRRSDTRLMSAGPSLAALTLFQLLTAFQLGIAMGSEYLSVIYIAVFGLMILMWVYVGVMKSMGNTSFEMETIAFFLSTLSLAVVGSSAPESMLKQFIAVLLGVVVFVAICLILRDLERTKALRWALLIGAALLLVANLAIGTFSYGAKNWIEIGGFSFQPSELVKVVFVWTGAATLDELYQKKNLTVFMLFSVYCFGCLGLMGDFGTAIIFFVTFLIISFLRSGDFSKLALMVGAAAAGGFMILRFRPYIADRFASWGHVWEAAMVDGAGFQQTRTMSAAASGGLVGVGAGEGWLEGVPAADTDMVFGMLIEEWGLIIAVLAVLSIVTLSVYAYRSIFAGRSTFYTIAACGAMSMFIFQTCLNVFGCVDILPFTGVTFPFVSNGGTSMVVSWALLSFLKAADTREQASIAVKAGGRI
ncbi:MAG: FtsW/RodA/SpoVE family cell cycle protein [Anaerovoracaceae bacterium]|nr:FtsW/RodA/SpoVE family cell cycle protein [Anaerovoracaceae bacterium]